MLRPQGLFHSPPPAPPEWQTPYPPGGQYPPSGPYPPPSGPYPQSGPYPPLSGQHPQPAGPPVWPAPPAGAVPSGAPVPPPGYPGGGPQSGGYPGPYANGQSPGAQYAGAPNPAAWYEQDQFQTGQFGPGTHYGPDDALAGGGPGGPEGPRSRFPFRRPKGPLLPVAVALLVAVIVVAALALSSRGGSSANKPTASTTAGATPSASASATSSLTRQQAATALSGLLAQSGTDHADVNNAVTRVETCKGLAGDARTFSKAAVNRRTLLAKLAQLPGRSALSAALISDLSGAWQASATVDADLAKWATDEAGGCKKNDFKDPNYTATAPFDSKATNGKTEFVGKWNSLAKKYSLPTYQPSQI